MFNKDQSQRRSCIYPLTPPSRTPRENGAPFTWESDANPKWERPGHPSIVARNLVRKMGLAGDSTTFDAIGRMSKCEKQGRLDDAIQAGISWTQQHPNDGSNDLVFKRIATVFLGKAQRDGRHAEGYVKEALVYRDKALPLDSDPSRGGAAWLACETWLLSLSPLVISQTSSDACNTETRISCFKKSFFA